ncbi:MULTISPECIES: hypothetical protein [Nocardioides]|uniref:Lipoprotein n=1 Tax=Nocardioides vastitatis TaxID=2568655 RepID=A0ABW0ZP56_9ACTN|nr:hypothetical protein [Nocardioides sp.]THJ04655.1 hypothetical protein E7Z54_08100 [Nocardioides sp.]
MSPIKRPLAAAGTAVLLGLSLTACGSSYPTDASKEDFCKDVEGAFTSFQSEEGAEPTEEQWENSQEKFAELGETGTPENIGEDERKGFEVLVDTIADLDYDEAKKAFESDEVPGVSEEDDKNVDKFSEWAVTECAEELGG